MSCRNARGEGSAHRLYRRRRPLPFARSGDAGRGRLDIDVAVGRAGTRPALRRGDDARAQVLVERGAVELDAHLMYLGLRVRPELEALLGDHRDVAVFRDEPAPELLQLGGRCGAAGEDAEVDADLQGAVLGRLHEGDCFVHERGLYPVPTEV